LLLEETSASRMEMANHVVGYPCSVLCAADIAVT